MKEFPPFRLDTANQCLWRRGDAEDQRILVTPKAFAVLRYLEHAGRRVTQDELEAVWPDTFVQPEVEFQRLAAAEEPSLHIARGQCVEGYGGAEPYYPMLNAIGRLCRGPEGNRVVEILAAQAPTWFNFLPW